MIAVVTVVMIGMVIIMVGYSNHDGDDLAPSNVHDNPIDSDVAEIYCRRQDLGKEPIVEEPQEDGAVTIDSDESSGDNDVEEIRQMNPNQRTLGNDSSVSWDSDLVVQQPEGVGVMNSDYTSEELYSLTKSLSDGDGDSEGEGDSDEDHGYGSNVDNVSRRTKVSSV